MTKILIDLQACQTQSRLRGMGRYARDLTKAIIAVADGAHEIHLLANAGLKASLVDIVSEFQHLVPEGHLHLVKLPKNVDLNNPLKSERAQIAGLILEGFVESLDPDIFFCPAFFEGFIDDAVTSAGKFTNVPIVATIHDLIPLLRPKQYLDPHPDYKRVYLSKLEELKKVAGLIAISDSARDEAIEHLGFTTDKVYNASEAADQVFQPREISTDDKKELLQRLGISTSFVLYTGGADPRKNLLRLLEAFARLPIEIRGKHALVLAGKVPEFERNELLDRARKFQIEDKIIFTGYISDDDLISLFNLTELFVFPSEHEGFGLPPLEAMQCGAATIGANRSSIPEVVSRKDALFDPTNIPELANLIEKVLREREFKRDLQVWGLERAKAFSWKNSARLALAHMGNFVKQSKSHLTVQQSLDRLDEVTIALSEEVIKQSISAGLSEAEISGLLSNIADNQTLLHFSIANDAPRGGVWRIEGPVDSSYSLAIVNRELARALTAEGEDVAIWSSEGPGDFDADPAFLRENPDISRMVDRGHEAKWTEIDVVSRNMYPPRMDDFTHARLALHNYAWEETVIPQDYVQGFNEYAQFITATSVHTKKVLIDNGVQVPIDVVYNGIDHGIDVEPVLNRKLDAKSFKFLHVSSCFPRKGADVLLKSFFDAFSSKDDVSLIIKTFPNPHNDIETQLKHLQESRDDAPDVRLIFDDLSDGELKALYLQCDVLVAPSRAEGFGLPIAEAMLEGMLVLTTNWSGQLDLALEGQIEWIDFDYARAKSHELSWDSVWAEPKRDHLAKLLKDAASRQLDREALKSNAKTLLETLSWRQVAKNSIASKNSLRRRLDLPKVGWVSTYRKKCGIATYSEHLIEHFNLPTVILADYDAQLFYEDRENVIPCWKEGAAEGGLEELRQQIESLDLDVVLIQFNYGFFAFEAFNELLLELKRQGRTVIVVLHATIDPVHDQRRKLEMLKPGLAVCDRLIVHSVHDLNRLKTHNIDQNATLVPHGCLTVANPDVEKSWEMPRPGEHLTIASYGFFLPNKGLLPLIEAVAQLNAEGQKCRLIMVNAEYPAPVSEQLVKQAKNLIRKKGLERQVRLHTDFLSDQESFDKINMADLLVYPYEGTGESASGAVRYGLSSGKPVLVSNSSMFDDIRETVFTLEGENAEAIASGIKSFISQAVSEPQSLSSLQNRARHWRHDHGYPTLSRRLEGMVKALFFENVRK